MRHRDVVVAWLLLGLGIGVWGCVKRAPQAGSTVQPATYYPLAVGNKWTYDSTFLGEKRKTEVEILRLEEGYFVDSMGGKMKLDPYGLRDDKRYLLREPLAPGHTWTNVVSVSSVERYRVLSVGGTCEAPAGQFHGCVSVESRNRVNERTTLVNEMTFAPGIGLVRLDLVAEIDGKRVPQSQLRLVAHQLRTASP